MQPGADSKNKPSHGMRKVISGGRRSTSPSVSGRSSGRSPGRSPRPKSPSRNAYKPVDRNKFYKPSPPLEEEVLKNLPEVRTGTENPLSALADLPLVRGMANRLERLLSEAPMLFRIKNLSTLLDRKRTRWMSILTSMST